MNLTQTLAFLNLSSRAGAIPGQRDVLDGRKVLFTGTAMEVWRWLQATGRIP